MSGFVDLTEKGTEAELQRIGQKLQSIYAEIEDLEAEAEQLIQYQKSLQAQLEQEKKEFQLQEKHIDWAASFSWDKSVEETLRTSFNLPQLRPLQREAINATLSHRDCLLVLPTGGGKSLCYQLAGVLASGLTLVISPLVSLMGDQVANLARLNINASFLSKETPRTESTTLFREMKSDTTEPRFLYISPEKFLLSKQLTTALEAVHSRNQLSRIVVDEVHCCSQWGHDFRPDYLKLGILKQRFPSVPLFACTATADASVRENVKKILRIESCVEIVGGLNRPNIFFEVREKKKKDDEVFKQICDFILTKYPNSSGIIYCLSQANSQTLANQLQKRGIRSEAYHAALHKDTREGVYSRWSMGRTKVVCATIAFGMGIDKGDVRFVVHHCLPKSLAAYYQECGRVGRDGKPSSCLLYFSPDDIGRVLKLVGYSSVSKQKFCDVVNYGLNISSCRRAFLLKALGEKKHEKCNKTCDLCKCPRKIEEINATQAAKMVISIVRASYANDKKGLTIKQLLTIWNSPAKLKKLGIDPKGGDCSGIDRSYFVAHLFVHQVLTEQLIDTSMSSNVYFIPGPAAGKIDATPFMFKKVTCMGEGEEEGKEEEEEEMGLEMASKGEDRKRKRSGKEDVGGRAGKRERGEVEVVDIDDFEEMWAGKGRKIGEMGGKGNKGVANGKEKMDSREEWEADLELNLGNWGREGKKEAEGWEEKWEEELEEVDKLLRREEKKKVRGKMIVLSDSDDDF